MTKTRAHASPPIIKKEVLEEKTIFEKILHTTKNASKNKNKNKNKNKITKHKTVETWVDITPRFVLFKSKSPSGNESDASLPSVPTLRKRSTITKEQITKLIHYIVKGKTSIKAAARKTGITVQSASRYYQKYKLDLERKAPSERTYIDNPPPKLTQKKIEEVIHYIVHDKMSVTQASNKANVSFLTAQKYYKKYLEDPEHKIPLVYNIEDRIQKKYTQEQINNLINYIVNDKMPVPEASRKVNVDPRSGRRYYLKYLEDPDHRIPVPGRNITRSSKTCTNEQVRALIGYIANDGMSLMEASVKAGIGQYAAKKYYKQYSEDPEHKMPTPEYTISSYSTKKPTNNQIKAFFTYIIIDKLTVSQASNKANISEVSGYNYYDSYLKNPRHFSEDVDNLYSVEKMKKMIEYIKNDNMTIKLAAKRANLSYATAHKYYQHYLKDPQQGIYTIKTKRYTQEDIRKFIGYVEHGKMSVRSAARKAKINLSSGYKFYKSYQKDPEHKIPEPVYDRIKSMRKVFDQYSKFIDDIYKSNPSTSRIFNDQQSA